MKTIRVGLAGCGFAGHIHARSLALIKASRISSLVTIRQVAVADSDLDRANATAAQYGWESAVDSWQKLLEHDLDLLIVALPNGEHAAIVKEAAERGTTVLLEKPVARTYDEALSMLALGDANPKIRVAYVNRFVPASQQAKLFIENGDLGDVRNVRSVYLLNMRRPGGIPDWRFDKNVAGYGASDDLGSHHIDLINFLAGNITNVQSDMRIWNIPHAPEATNDDAVNSLITLENGAFGTLSASRTTPGHPLTGYIEIEGSKSAIKVDRTYLNDLFIREANNLTQRAIRPTDDFATLWASPTVQGAHPFSWYDCFAFQMAELVKIAAGIELPRLWSATLREGVYAMSVTESMAQSAELHKPQQVTP